MDETFYVSQFVKGLKNEIQYAVISQLPTIVDKAQLLAQIQQDIIDNGGMKFTKQPVVGRLRGGNRAEGKGVEVGG
jgi:hypothetical protein